MSALDEGSARRHFLRFGQNERRHPNPAAMIAALEQEFGLLEPDFDFEHHRDLHPHLKRRPHHPWEVVEHHLRNRAALSKAAPKKKRGQLAGAPARVIRSEVETLRSTLTVVFGLETADLALVRAVFEAAAVVKAHPTPASALLEPVILARYLLSAPSASSSRLDSFAAQLGALHFALFERVALARSRAEMTVVNRLIPVVIASEVASTGASQPPLTLLMLAARAASGLPVEPQGEEVAVYVADFFARLVQERRLQPFITQEQRTILCRTAPAPDPPIPLAALYRRQAGPGGLPGPEIADPAAFNAWFWETGVRMLGLDYILPTDMSQVAAAEDEVQPPKLTDDGVSHLTLRLRPGTLLTFGAHSNGAAHCIGEGWRAKARAHEWKGDSAPLLAFRLAAADVGPLDLFLDLQIFGGLAADRIFVAWNGRLLEDARMDGGRLYAHLGLQHRLGREANILSLTVRGNAQVNRERRPRFALQQLVLARR